MQKILLVDDDELIAEFVTDAAELIGISVTTIENGRDIQALNLAQFEHILLDLSVPGADGVQILRLLQQKNFSGAISIASGCDISVLNSAQQLGANYGLNMTAPLVKPYPLEILLNTLRSTIPERFTSKQNNRSELDEITLLPGLKRAIENKSIQVFYQPRFDIKTRNILGVEALARWIQDDGSMIPPPVFIELAEKHNLIEALTECIVEQVLPQLALWNQIDFELQVSINFSAYSLSDLDLPDYLSQMVTQYNIAPKNVVIELTESALAEDSTASLEILTRLRMKGFDLSIDDFGTGYSSIQQLQDIPFSELKIDRSFISNYATRLQSKTIIESTIEMAHKLGIKVVAEGIEDQKTIEYLKAIGCDQGQGFFYAQPMPAEKLTQWLKEHPECIPELDNVEKRLSIVALDNDGHFIESLKEILTLEFNFSFYTEPVRFLTEIENTVPDIILLGVDLPELDGFAICQKIKASARLNNTAIIFVTETDSKSQKIKAFVAGGDDFLTKPIKSGALLAKLRAIEHYQLNHKAIADEQQLASNVSRVAFQSTDDLIQYKTLTDFCLKVYSCKTESEFIALFYQLAQQLSLSVCIQLNSLKGKKRFRAFEVECNPMEESLFHLLSDVGQLYYFDHTCIANNKHVAILIKNMPFKGNANKQYNQFIIRLTDIIEKRWGELKHEQIVSELLINLESVLGALKNKFIQFETGSHHIIDKLLLETRLNFDLTNISKINEEKLIKIIENAVEKVMELGGSGREIEIEFMQIISQFKNNRSIDKI